MDELGHHLLKVEDGQIVEFTPAEKKTYQDELSQLAAKAENADATRLESLQASIDTIAGKQQAPDKPSLD